MLEQLLGVVDLRVVAVFLIVFLLSRWYLRVRAPGLPPGPFPLPVVGNFLSLRSGALDQLLIKWRRLHVHLRLRDVFMYYLGGHRVVAVCGYDNLRELLTRTGDDSMFRPQLYLAKVSAKGNKGVIPSNGPRWKESRKLTSMSLRDPGAGRQSPQAKVVEEAGAPCQPLHENDGKTINVKPPPTNRAPNAIC